MTNSFQISTFSTAQNDLFFRIVENFRESKNVELEPLRNLIYEHEAAYVSDRKFVFRNFQNRRQLAEALWNAFHPGSDTSELVANIGTWNYLSACMMYWLRYSNIDFSVGENARWLLQDNSLRFHRHLVYGPFAVFSANSDDPDKAMAALATSITKPGEVVERISGKASLMRGSAIELATLLYFDKETNKLKESNSSIGRQVDKNYPGSPQRLSVYLSQIDLTIDFQEMPISKLLEILPEEFKVWLD